MVFVKEEPAHREVQADGARIVAADKEPGNWMSTGRTYDEQRYSPLKKITDQNVGQLGLAWQYKLDYDRGVEATPIVVDGVMYVHTPFPNTVTALDLDRAFDVARGDALRRGVNEIAVVGGADIFTRLMPLADRLEITHVHARPEGDTHFPPIDASQWRATAKSELPAGPKDEAPATCVTYERA